MKKKLSFVLALVIFCSTFALFGCSDPFKDTLTVKLTFVWSEDESVTFERIGYHSHDYPISVPFQPSGYYKVRYEIYKGKQLVKKGSKIGSCSTKPNDQYQVTINYTQENLWSPFVLLVTVEDTRITPTIVLDPNGAIEYTQNERYVYKYDGQSHLTSVIYTNLPKAIYCTYGDKIIYFESFSIWLNGRTILNLTEIGVYEIRYTVLASKYIDEKDKLYCAPTNLYITVEIIE